MIILTPAKSPHPASMNDNVHAKLLDALAKQNFTGVPPDMRAELLEFYADPNAPYATKRKSKEWAKVETELQQLKTFTPPPITAAEALPPVF
jgi:hypothetical protein